MQRFSDRRDAGRQLAKRLQRYVGRSDVLVVGLPRGGMPVAQEVARALKAPLEAFVVRAVDVPGQDHVAMGALASGGVRVVDRRLTDIFHVSDRDVDDAMLSASHDVETRERKYRSGRPFPDLRGTTVIVVDDAMGSEPRMTAVIKALRTRHPAAVVVAAPVGAADVCARLRCLADDCVVALAPFPFRRARDWYQDYDLPPEPIVSDSDWKRAPIMPDITPHSPVDSTLGA